MATNDVINDIDENEVTSDVEKNALEAEIESIKAEQKEKAEQERKNNIDRKKEEKRLEQLKKQQKKFEHEQEKKLLFESKAEIRALEKNKSKEDKLLTNEKKYLDKVIHNPKMGKKLRKRYPNVERFETGPDGLNEEQVKLRINQGLNNYKSQGSTKTVTKIILDNIFTFFNLLTFAIAGWLISISSIKDLTFLVIVLANMIIGTVQEIRAKKTIDKLSLISAPVCEVIRNGKIEEVSIEELVLDDLMCLENGKQICSDSIVYEGQIEVNESLLTGESDAIIKKKGDMLYSGSFVVSGNCKARVEKVGQDNYIERLTGQAKQYRKPNSELLKSLSLIITVMAFVIIPAGIGLFCIQRFKNGLDYDICVRKTAGAMIGMIPSGLYLVTSIALAVGVLRLSRNNVLVQELYCIEMLARVDVLCLDKTGTITDGSMNVKNVVDYDIIDGLPTKDIVSALLNATNDKNLTNVALETKFGRAKRLKHKAVIPFSSQRKYSGATFEDYGTFIIGAPEFVLKSNFNVVAHDVNKYAKEGYRVLVIAHTKEPITKGEAPDTILKPISLILIEDNVRPDAIKTINYFKESGVEVKVISGDNPITVSKVSERAGIENADQYISLDGLTDTEVVRAASKYTVFGRVSPAQKKLLVKTLQELGHKVAMTGDGVNDILALKEADCSIAVASGSEAARNVSHLVLLDSNFDSMPKVVQEGRRVISNVAKVSKLYLTKTIFSLLLAIVALIQGSYPISTNQLLMIDSLCIGLPSVILVLEPNNQMAPKHFLSTIIKSALPGAVVIVIQSILVFGLQNSLDMTSRITSTLICITATFTCMMVLYETCKPFNNNTRKTLFGGCFCAFLLATVMVPSYFDFAPIFPAMEYHSKNEEVLTWETQMIKVSQANYYTVDGVVLEVQCPKQTSTHSAEVNEDGNLVLDNTVQTNNKPSLPTLTLYDGKYYVIGAKKTELRYNPSNISKVEVGSNGDVSIIVTSGSEDVKIPTNHNILPKVTISNGYYYVNDYMTTKKTTKSSVGKVNLRSDYEVFVDDEYINYTLFDGDGLIISFLDNYLYLGGSRTTVENNQEQVDLQIRGKEYLINGINTGVLYTPEIGTTKEGYYIVNGKITDYKCNNNGTAIAQSLTTDGHLKIDGKITDIVVEFEITKGGTVTTLPLSSIILLVCLCLSSHPLIAIIKSVVPFSKRQYKKLTDLLNKI